MDIMKNIINTNTLNDIQDRLAKLVGVPTITVDVNGNPVCGISNFTPFCNLIRSSKKGVKKCITCDSEAGFKAVKEGKPNTYRCHTGLIDCVAPIIVNGHFLGSVLGGQVLLDGEDANEVIDIEKISEEFEIPLESLRKSLQHIPFISREYLQNYVDFYTFLSSYIAQMGIYGITQEELLKESREKFRLEQQAKKMELNTIRAQIHPHFLFNTLNTIARMAMIEDAPRTEDLIYKLSDLLRYNLKNIEEYPKLSEEVENIKRYLFIQSLRYSDRISYNIDIEESIMDYRILSMIMQPIVENSMIHGLETKREGGEISIIGRALSNNDILIKVSDNGKGINLDLLNKLNDLDSTPDNCVGIGIGIKNTHDRIKHRFGEKYGLKIESQLNIGTNVNILIPPIK